MSSESLRITNKTSIVRTPSRGSYDRAEAYRIIDSTPMCHVSYLIDEEPYITPTFQWRTKDQFFWHGSSASRKFQCKCNDNMIIKFEGKQVNTTRKINSFYRFKSSLLLD